MLSSTEKTTESIVSMLSHMTPVAQSRMESLRPSTREALLGQAAKMLGSPSDVVSAVYAFNTACDGIPKRGRQNRISALIVVFSGIISNF